MNVLPRTNTVLKMSLPHISYISIIRFIETLIILSNDHEITIDLRALTDGDAVLSDGTFLPSKTIADGELFPAFQIFEKFKCEIISIV